jgi:hypothetical protein
VIIRKVDHVPGQQPPRFSSAGMNRQAGALIISADAIHRRFLRTTVAKHAAVGALGIAR